VDLEKDRENYGSCVDKISKEVLERVNETKTMLNTEQTNVCG